MDGVCDCLHYGSAVLVNTRGDILWKIGNPYRPTFERSTSKPFRAVALVASGAFREYKLKKEHLALISGSHNGTHQHIQLAEEIANICDLPLTLLKCGLRRPLGGGFIDDLSLEIQQLANECSGEHLGVLAMCQFLKLPMHNYTDASHLIHVVINKTIDEFMKGLPPAVTCVADRCGLPTSVHSLHSLATRILRLVDSANVALAPATVVSAISECPYIYTGESRLVGDLISATQGRLLGKCGAMGLYTIAWRKQHIGLAVKISDGNHRAAWPLIQRCASINGLELPSEVNYNDPDLFGSMRYLGD